MILRHLIGLGLIFSPTDVEGRGQTADSV